MRKRIISGFRSLPFILFISFFTAQLFGANGNNGKYYREDVFLHIGRDTYVAGEKIWFNAYCSNVSNPGTAALSKVVYVELVDNKNTHIFGRILNVKSGTSESCIDLPDTIASGTYFLKAYTQWMKNFGSESFFSQPVYIYNIYADENTNVKNTINVPDESKIFIEGNQLIDGIPTRIAFAFPTLKEKGSTFKVIEKETNQVKTEFTLNKKGIGFTSLLPTAGYHYQCVLSDSSKAGFQYNLPDVSKEGCKISVNEVTKDNIHVNIEQYNLPGQRYLIELHNGDKVLDSKTTNVGQLKNIVLSTAGFAGSIVEIIVLDMNHVQLASEVVMLKAPFNIELQSLQKYYKPGEKADFKFILESAGLLNELTASVTIYKEKPSLNSQLPSLFYEGRNLLFDESGNNFSIGFEEYIKKDLMQSTLPESILPVEDQGIVFTGTVLDQQNHDPISGVNILFSVKDSMPDIQSVVTDSEGRFALLVNIFGTPKTFISVFKDNQPITKQCDIVFDKKFYYQDKPFKFTFPTFGADSVFTTDIKDEAQRSLIQRVFAKKDDNSVGQDLPLDIKSNYYSNSLITVVTDDFFSMPNFEEIAREILPRVQYKKAKDGCNFVLFTSAPESKSNNPLVLLNGVPVEDKCDLFEINSEMITKILIQHESRIVGNLYYDGIIAINTVPTIKSKYLKANTDNLIEIPCYNICPEFNPSNFSKAGNPESKLPDFRNLLYRESFKIQNNEPKSIQFITSDEEGEYIIDIRGFLSNGTPIVFQEGFTVQSK